MRFESVYERSELERTSEAPRVRMCNGSRAREGCLARYDRHLTRGRVIDTGYVLFAVLKQVL